MFKIIGNVHIGGVNILKKQIEFSTRPDDKEFYGIRYYDVESPILSYIYSLLPSEVHKDFYSSLLMINDNLPAHTDIVETAAFNCYIKPGNYYTSFYTSKPNPTLSEYADHGEGHIYQPEDLVFMGGFQAKQFDIVLINNKVIHGVVSNTLAKEVREVLQLATNKYSYNEVCNMLKGV